MIPFYLFALEPAFESPYWHRLPADQRRALARRLYCFGWSDA
jgi:hypothetical protein